MPISLAAPRRPLRLHKTFSERCSKKTSRFSLKVPRSLWRIADECVKSNTILLLGSLDQALGSLDQAAKEFVVLRFCRLCIDTALVGAKKACILAPFVSKAKEYKAAAMGTPGLLRTQLIIGTDDVDVWKRKDWRDAVEQNDVLICTPQLFFDALRSEHIAMGEFCAIAFDECQHCIGSGPMAKIVSKYVGKPGQNLRVLGLGMTELFKYRRKYRERAEEALCSLCFFGRRRARRARRASRAKGQRQHFVDAKNIKGQRQHFVKVKCCIAIGRM